MKLLTIGSLLFLLSSCSAFYSGYTTSNVSYNGNNAEIVDLVSAKNSVTRVLGFGGTEREALVLETKRKMYRQNPLKKGQVYANIGVDVKQAVYLFVNVETVTVSADVIEFYTDSAEHAVFSKLLNQSTSYDKEKVLDKPFPFAENKSIYFLNQKEVKIGTVQTIQDNLLKVKAEDGHSFYVDITKSFHRIKFSNLSELKEVSFLNGENTEKGHIVGQNEKYFIIQHSEGLSAIKRSLISE